MTTYYIRADGSAANKGAATGPSTDATKCMAMATFNSQTYSSGDIILASSAGGNFTSSMLPPSTTGASTITNEIGETPSIVSSGSDACVTGLQANWTVSNFFLDGRGSTNATVVANQSMTITDCLMFGKGATNSPCVRFFGAGVGLIMTNCSVSGALEDGVRLEGTGTNTITNVTTSGHTGYGIAIWGGTTNIIGLKSYSNTKSGVYAKNAAIVDIMDSVAYSNAVDGFYSEGTGSMTCTRCVSYTNGTAGSQFFGDGFTSHDTVTFNMSNCIAYGNFASGAGMTGGSSGYIYNSTFYNNYDESESQVKWEDNYGMGIGIGETATGTWDIKNNICSNNGTELLIDTTSGATVTSDYNILNNSRGGNNAFYYDGTPYATLTLFVAASSTDAASLDSDPLFRDATLNILTLGRDSPAINAGVLVSSFEYRLDPDSVWTDSVSVRYDPIIIGAYGFKGIDPKTVRPDTSGDRLIRPARLNS